MAPASAPGPDLAAAHAAIEAAIAAGDPAGLPVLGVGEMSLVVGWPPAAPAHALKRLPPFAGPAAVAAYARLVADYVAALGERGVACVPTQVRVMPARGGPAAYLVQPLTAREDLLDHWLREAAGEEEGRAALGALAATVAGAADAVVGIDAQISNWARTGEGLALLDLTTPILRDASGRERLDTAIFTSVYPWPVRLPLRRLVAPGVLAAYHDPRRVLLDAAANLLRENLDAWVPALLDAAGAVLPEPLRREEVERHHRADTRLWATTERLRRTERWWRTRVRRRAYPVLLAPPGAIRPPRTGASAGARAPGGPR